MYPNINASSIINDIFVNLQSMLLHFWLRFISQSTMYICETELTVRLIIACCIRSILLSVRVDTTRTTSHHTFKTVPTSPSAYFYFRKLEPKAHTQLHWPRARSKRYVKTFTNRVWSYFARISTAKHKTLRSLKSSSVMYLVLAVPYTIYTSSGFQ